MRKLIGTLAVFTMAACSDGPAAPDSQPGFFGEVQAEGIIRSAGDGSPVAGAELVVIETIHDPCDFTDIWCTSSKRVIARTESATDGSYSLRFKDTRCENRPEIHVKISADRFQASGMRLKCEGQLQHADAELAPTLPWGQAAPSEPAVAGQDIRFDVKAWSDWGLASFTIRWGDGSQTTIPIDGQTSYVAETMHVYAEAGKYEWNYVVTDVFGQSYTRLVGFVITVVP